MDNSQITAEKFGALVAEGKATWWQMKLPSGDVIFGTTKTDMLGLEEKDYTHFGDFMKLVHEDDYEPAMKAMRDHLKGDKPFYETLYRIRHKDSHYITFYDCGQIVEKDGENITLMGFVVKLEGEEDIKERMEEFKKLILEGNPSMIDLVKDMGHEN